MALPTKQPLSESTNGRPIPVVATTSPGTLIHTAVAGSASADVLTLYANNIGSVERKLSLQVGGVTNGDLIEVGISPEAGDVLVLAGIPLQGGVEVRAFAPAGNEINLKGRYDRIATP